MFRRSIRAVVFTASVVALTVFPNSDFGVRSALQWTRSIALTQTAAATVDTSPFPKLVPEKVHTKTCKQIVNLLSRKHYRKQAV